MVELILTNKVDYDMTVSLDYTLRIKSSSHV